MRFSVVGFIVGAICALIFYAVATALVTFANSGLVFGLAALLIWAALTLNWSGRGGRVG
jgi:multisubunit Na+/H+ antiporter MnhE subunit